MRQLQQELIDRTESGTNYDDLAEEILRLRELQEQTVMDDAAKAEWFPISDLPELAFDHEEIMSDAINFYAIKYQK